MRHFAKLLTLTLACALAAATAHADHHAAGEAKSMPEGKAMPKADAKPAAAPTGIAKIEAFIAKQKINKTAKGWKLDLPMPPRVGFPQEQKIFWVLETNHGTLKFELLPSVAPMHVASTVYLTKLGFYDNTSFHRVIPGFMAQAGDPLGTGTGGPGYEYAGEFSRTVRHDTPGLLSMANRGPKTDGSQFFITFTATPHLDDKHTIFGKLIEGEGTLKELEKRGSRRGTPSEPLQLRRATIEVM